MRPIRLQSGLTYLALLFFVATMGVMLAMSGTIWSTAQRRIKERELLYIGNEFRSAIGSYYERTPGTLKRYPPTLEDLMLDSRMLYVLRHLRRVYPDPLAPQAQWGVLRSPDGGIMGVYSSAEGTPIKRGGFRLRDVAFEGATRYADWRFIYEPVLVVEPKKEAGSKEAGS